MAENMQQPAENSAMLMTISRLISSKLDLADLLKYIVRAASQVVGAERASLYLLDEKTQELYFDVALGLPPEVQKMRFKLGEGYAGACAKEARSLLVNDVSGDSAHSKRVDNRSGYVTRSILSSPIVMRGRVLGVIQALNRVEGPFTGADIQTFEAFASQIAVAIENARLFSSLREEKRRLQVFFTNTNEGAVLTGPGGEILLANDVADNYLSQGEAPRRDIAAAFAGMDMSPALDKILSAQPQVMEFSLEREKPKRLFLEGSAIKLQRKGEKEAVECEGWLWLFRDATARHAEQQLERSFLSLVSHKLRTPLTVINGYSQTLCEELAPGAPASPFALKAAATIGGQGRKLSALVEELISFVSMDELSAASLKKPAIKPSALLEEACKLFDDAHAGDKIVRVDSGENAPPAAPGQAALAFARNCAADVPEFQGDGRRLARALACLLDNAVKFNAKKSKLVRLLCSHEGGMVKLSVEDNGAGIPPEEFSRIFDKFYQVENSFSGQVEGWGIGLAFVRKVASAHGGEVSVKSELDKGSVFTITLPAACPP